MKRYEILSFLKKRAFFKDLILTKDESLQKRRLVAEIHLTSGFSVYPFLMILTITTTPIRLIIRIRAGPMILRKS